MQNPLPSQSPEKEELSEIFNKEELTKIQSIFTTHRAKSPNNGSQIINCSQYLEHENICFKQKLDFTLKNSIDKCHSIREKQLLEEIESLRDEMKMLENHCKNVNERYQVKRDEYNQLTLDFVDIQEKQEWFREKLLQSERLWESKFREMKEEQKEQVRKYSLEIKEYQNKIRSLECLLQTAEQQEKSIKCFINEEANKNKIKEEQFAIKINQLLQQQTFHHQRQDQLERELAQKSNDILEKNQYCQSLEKSIKEVMKRMQKTEEATQKEILRERSISKKALDGLQMTKKHSELQEQKSRKKEKIYLKSQKELIGKIKEICKDQSVLENTTIKGNFKKSETKSLNTTLRLGKGEKENLSPFVSNFVLEDDTSLKCSPIKVVSKDRKIFPNTDNEAKSAQNTSIKYQSTPANISKLNIDIVQNIKPDSFAPPTPCFELSRQTHAFE